jgi:uncharacterized tellurite resistance protein B-like protein
MHEAGLDQIERDQVRRSEGAEGAVTALVALPVEDRRAVVDALVDAAFVDGCLADTESAAVRRLSAQLGIA